MATPIVYIVTDLRTVPDSQTGGWACLSNTTQHSTRNGAEERYHTALAAAARSTQYPVYAAILATNEGAVLAHECYYHEVEPTPEPTPEPEQE